MRRVDGVWSSSRCYGARTSGRMEQLLHFASMSIRYLIMLASAQRKGRRQRPPRLEETLRSSVDTCAKNHNKWGSDSALQTLKKLPEHLA